MVFKHTAFGLAFLAAITFMFTGCSHTSRKPGQVKVEGGWIEGMVEGDLVVFRGIPFARRQWVSYAGGHRSRLKNGTV